MPERPRLDHEPIKREMLDIAKGFFGARFHGPDEVRTVYGVSLEKERIPQIPYTERELQEAAERGEMLVLRVDQLADGRPVTLQNLIEYFQREKAFEVFTHGDKDAEWVIDELPASPFTEPIPTASWKLVTIEEIPETRHITFNAKEALLALHNGTANEEALSDALREMTDEMEAAFARGESPFATREELDTAIRQTPTVEALKRAMERFPPGVEMPSAVELTYDLLLHFFATNERLLADYSVATRSCIPACSGVEGDGTPWSAEARPLDIGGFGYTDEDGAFHPGIGEHKGRSTRFARFRKLAPSMTIPGLPIGYLQH